MRSARLGSLSSYRSVAFTASSIGTLVNSDSISSETILDNKIMVSFDVESLFTYVPIDDAVQVTLLQAQGQRGNSHNTSNNINRDSGIEIPEAWMPTIKKKKHNHSCPIQPHCNDPLKANSVRSIRTDR